MSTHSVDDLLVRVENNKLGVEQAPLPPVEPKQEAVSQPIDVLHGTSEAPQETPIEQKKEPIPIKPEQKEPEPEKLPEAASADSPIDEYGNPVEKPRMYTDEEVQSIIRDRLSRGRHAEQQPIQPVQQQTGNKEATNDSGSDEPWDVQLKQFVKQTLEETQREESTKQWQREEMVRQAEFESKFSTGMERYKDFKQVVAGKPITDTMMLAARNLDNPAAFIYGAAKMHPQEIERIARIQDPYAQAAEVGKLHERMVKASRAVSAAPKPIETPKTSLPNKAINQPSLESRIEAYAKQKRR